MSKTKESLKISRERSQVESQEILNNHLFYEHKEKDVSHFYKKENLALSFTMNTIHMFHILKPFSFHFLQN